MVEPVILRSMVKRIAILFILAFMMMEAPAQQPFNVMTFNLRLNIESDSSNAWKFRKDHAASQILFHDADIIGVQEALYDQMQDLQQRLPGFASHGVGREDGATKGEFSAIFYRTDRFEKQGGSTFWLSLTPNVPGSKSWDAAITRIVSWMKLKDKTNGKIFYAFNTHFDHMGQEARRQSAQMLLKAVDSIAGKTPAVITGDFNATPSDEPIKIITDQSNKLHLTDTKAISKTGHFGPEGTFTAFGPFENSDEPIDHIFIKGKMEVLKHATLAESWKGRFSSDHFPVWCRILIQ
jgi:endonuclease/exonuclease/phosphatase family metal-dependent hydrolase